MQILGMIFAVYLLTISLHAAVWFQWWKTEPASQRRGSAARMFLMSPIWPVLYARRTAHAVRAELQGVWRDAHPDWRQPPARRPGPVDTFRGGEDG